MIHKAVDLDKLEAVSARLASAQALICVLAADETKDRMLTDALYGVECVLDHTSNLLDGCINEAKTTREECVSG